MSSIRIIPTLLIKNGGLVKGRRFKDHSYVGDPINAVKIFNDKEVDEIVLIDISEARIENGPNINRIAEIASEAFMPLSYGGGISKIEHVDDLMFNGVEKVILNTAAVTNPSLISEISNKYGRQSVIVSIDVKKNWLKRYSVYTLNATKNTGKEPVDFARECEDMGAGELLLTSINNEGTYSGYDLDMINMVSKNISIPLVANGGASNVDDFQDAISNGASAVAAGSMFVYQRPYNAVLISYISRNDIESITTR